MILKLAQQKRPKKPEGAVQLGLTNPIWETVEVCWKSQPLDRLTAAKTLEIWENEINGGDSPKTKTEEQGERRRSRRISSFVGEKKTSCPLHFLS